MGGEWEVLNNPSTMFVILLPSVGVFNQTIFSCDYLKRVFCKLDLASMSTSPKEEYMLQLQKLPHGPSREPVLV